MFGSEVVAGIILSLTELCDVFVRFGFGEVIGDVRSIRFRGGVLGIVDLEVAVEAGTKKGRRDAARFLPMDSGR